MEKRSATAAAATANCVGGGDMAVGVVRVNVGGIEGGERGGADGGGDVGWAMRTSLELWR